MTALAGLKIAVLLETEYIPDEIRAYQQYFGAWGAQVDLMTRLWGLPQVTFVSDVDAAGPTLADTRAKLEQLTVSIDFRSVKLEDYAAVLVAANYCSVRLRHFRPEDENGDLDWPNASPSAAGPVRPELTRIAPAVRFFGDAMTNPNIVKGALCHALWLLTPTPEHLAGRRVICHEVVLADIFNAGAEYVPSITNASQTSPERPAPGIVVDSDLVTGNSAHVVRDYCEAIKNCILNRAKPRLSKAVAGGAAAVSGKKSRRVLTLLSEYGYWGEELLGPLEVFDGAGYDVEFATPKGGRARALPPSMDPRYVDPPLGKPVTSAEVARKVQLLDDMSPNRGPQSKRLDNPRSLLGWVPERPYWSHPNFVRVIEAYHRALARLDEELASYDALLLVGGSGPLIDLVNNQRVHDLILAFHRANKPIAAACYGVACLAFARDTESRRSIISGKRVTGHCIEYDYKDGTGVLGIDANFGPPFFPLEYILRDATGPSGEYIGNFGHPTSVIVDFPFITGRSTPDSYPTGEKLVDVLEHGLRRFGW